MKLSDEKQKSLKETFDCIKALLENCRRLVEVVLKRIEFMLEHIDVDETKIR